MELRRILERLKDEDAQVTAAERDAALAILIEYAIDLWYEGQGI